MAWLFGCFKCTGKPELDTSHRHRTRIKNRSSGVVSGNPNSAAVAHATSPEDLHTVRGRVTDLAAVSNVSNERECCDSSLLSYPSPSRVQTKKIKVAKLNLKRDITSNTDFSNREHSHEDELDEELESLRQQLMQEADVAKILSDEVKYLRACHSLLDVPSDTFKVTIDKLEKSSSAQVECGQDSWLVSSIVRKIQREELLMEVCSTPSSPFHCLSESCSLHNRKTNTFQSDHFEDKSANSNVLKCPELNPFRKESNVCDELVQGLRENIPPQLCIKDCKSGAAHEVQSPPWNFSEAKHDIVDHKSSPVFESSENLLLEHLDISSLIKDSSLITNWELSLGDHEAVRFHDQSLHACHAPSHAEECEFGKVDAESAPSTDHALSQEVCEIGKLDAVKSAPLSEGRPKPDGDIFDNDLSCSMVLSEIHLVNGMISSQYSSVYTSSNSIEAQQDITSCERDICAEGGMDANVDVEPPFVKADLIMAAEGGDNGTATRPSKRSWSCTIKNALEKESSISVVASYLRLDENDGLEKQSKESKDSDDEKHALLECVELDEMNSESRIHVSEGACVHLAASTLFLKTRSLETSAAQSFDGVENTNSTGEDDNEAQRKKLRHRTSSSSESVIGQVPFHGLQHENVPVGEQVGLLEPEVGDGGDSPDSHSEVGDGENHSEVDAQTFDESLDSEFVDETPSNQAPDLSLASSLVSQMHTPPKFVETYRYPALLADERPILGTVAAHWSPISTRKWWDGKGIPNSTNKYKEDQKVNWHAIPFEVRLEQALAKQDNVLSK